MSDLVVITFPDETSGPAALQAHARGAEERRSRAQGRGCRRQGRRRQGQTTTRPTAPRLPARSVVASWACCWALCSSPSPASPSAPSRAASSARASATTWTRASSRDVTNDLGPGTSAVFVLVEGHACALVGSVRHLGGKVYQTTLDPDLEQQLNESLQSQG